MVDNQHKKITGYRDLSEAEIGLMNSVKLHAESIGTQIEALEAEILYRQTMARYCQD